MERDIPRIGGYQKLYDKAMTGKSRKSAMKAFCLECCGWERTEVHLCSDTGCPLYLYRPYKNDKADKTLQPT